MKSRSLLIAAAAVLGLGAGQATSSSAPVRSAEQQQAGAALKNGGSTKEIKEDHFGGYAGGLLRGLMRDRGNTPRDWGMSKACARMVRKNRMHRMGISHARI
jgi:hypothetical protein